MSKYQTLNTTELMTGKDGRLYVEVNGKNEFLAEINTFKVNMTANTVDVQPVNDIVVHPVPTGVTLELSLTEMVIRDDVIMEPLLKALRNGQFPVYNFQGVCYKPDGQEQRYTFNNAVPKGTFGIMNLTPGEVISREQTFGLNEIPESLSSIVSTYLNK